MALRKESQEAELGRRGMGGQRFVFSEGSDLEPQVLLIHRERFGANHRER